MSAAPPTDEERKERLRQLDGLLVIMEGALALDMTLAELHSTVLDAQEKFLIDLGLPDERKRTPSKSRQRTHLSPDGTWQFPPEDTPESHLGSSRPEQSRRSNFCNPPGLRKRLSYGPSSWQV